MNKEEISEKLKNNVKTAVASTANANDDRFFTQFNEKWSIAENLVHLAKGAKSFNNALALPKAAIASFGKPEIAARNYDEVVAFYQAVLAKGVVATGGFVPQLPDNQRDKSEVIERFMKQHDVLLEHLSAWEEEELDNFVVPHPVLGKLSLREMYYFTTYHISHHQAAIDRILAI